MESRACSIAHPITIPLLVLTSHLPLVRFSLSIPPSPTHHLQLLAPFYTPSSTLIWNGTQVTGLEAIGALIGGLPPSIHEIYGVEGVGIAGESLGLEGIR